MPSCKWASLVSSSANFPQSKWRAPYGYDRTSRSFWVAGPNAACRCARCRSDRFDHARPRADRVLSGGIPHADGANQRHPSSCSRRREGAGGRPATRLRRHGRHVGAAGEGARQGPHGHRAGSPRHGLVRPSGYGLYEEEPGCRYRIRIRAIRRRTRLSISPVSWMRSRCRRRIS